MRLIVLVILSLFCTSTGIVAQPSKADSLKKLKQSRSSLSIEIEAGLKRILERYRNKPNLDESWAAIRGEADNFLLSYFRKGRLVGSKPQEAYFVSIGVQTMTAADIQANKKIMMAGFSENKPAEFKVITIETTGVSR